METRKFQINEIARMYRIPPHMVGDLEKSSFSNIEQQSLEFVKYTLDPWVVRWEQALQKALLLPQEKNEYFIKLMWMDYCGGTIASRMNGYAVGGRMDGCQQMISGKWKIRIQFQKKTEEIYIL
mgnify:CR=1 FL=1